MNIFAKKNRKKFKAAETILEVIVAIFVVAVGAEASTVLVIDALRTNGISRDNLIAMNLAVEGAEAVRNIRDSNWLKFNFDKETCWNMLPELGACSVDGAVPEGNYKPYFDPTTMGWKLDSAGSTVLDLNGDALLMAPYMLSIADADKKNADSNNDNIYDNDRDLYIATISTVPDPMKIVDTSKFYRMVSISYPSAQEMTVTSVVQWKDGVVHQVKLVTKLTNYLKFKVK